MYYRNPDEDYRALERRYKASGADEDYIRYAIAARRAGISVHVDSDVEYAQHFFIAARPNSGIDVLCRFCTNVSEIICDRHHIGICGDHARPNCEEPDCDFLQCPSCAPNCDVCKKPACAACLREGACCGADACTRDDSHCWDHCADSRCEVGGVICRNHATINSLEEWFCNTVSLGHQCGTFDPNDLCSSCNEEETDPEGLCQICQECSLCCTCGTFDDDDDDD